MNNKDYLCRVIKNINKGCISLKKRTQRNSLLPYSINIKRNIKLKNFIKNEINIKHIINNMLNSTNKIYDIFQINPTSIKLDNEDYSKRAKAIKNIKDFISINILYTNNKTNSDNILCEVLYYFDLLIIQNKKFKLLSTFEKLGLGALILVLKFNKIQDKILIKKYKSIFNDKYMTLEEINKIEVLSLKLINYYIIQPNQINYLNFLFKNFFLNDKYRNMNYIYKQIISILKNIMCFSNNYIKIHPFNLSCFIIKYCFEQNKIDGFQKTLIEYFDMNMRLFRAAYEDFILNNNNLMKIAIIIERQKLDENSKKSEINNTIKKLKNYEISKCNYITNIYSSTMYKTSKKDIRKNNINVVINPMNNTYYKKFLNNYISENTYSKSKIKNSEYKHHNRKTTELSEVKNIKVKKIKDKDNDENIKINTKLNYSIESPKKCGISLKYRYKRKIPVQLSNLNNKITFFKLKKIQESKKNNKDNEKPKDKKIEEIKNEDLIDDKIKNEKYKKINVEERIERSKEKIIKNEDNDNNKNKDDNDNKKNIEKIEEYNRENKYKRLNLYKNDNFINQEDYHSIRNSYKNKKIKNMNEYKIQSFLTNYTSNNTINTVNVKILEENSIKKKEEPKLIKAYLEKRKNYMSQMNNFNTDDSNLKSTVNQSESSTSNFKEKKIEIKRGQKVHIRNFYKQKNSLLLNISNIGRNRILLK